MSANRSSAGGTAIMSGDLRQAEHQLAATLARFRNLGDRWDRLGRPVGQLATNHPAEANN